MRNTLIILVIVMLAKTPSATLAQQPETSATGAARPMARAAAELPALPAIYREETPQQTQARLKWLREARFGMFIHWGVYAVPAGEYQGRRGTEWIMNQARIPIAEYKELAKQFTAAKYDPKAWVAMAKNAGMKYIVLTAKHHDGFALYDSAYSDWNAVKQSGAKRDLIQPLADAAREAGLTFCLYYSQSQDWTNPGGGIGSRRTEPWDPAQTKVPDERATNTKFDEYLAKIALPQTREILDKYKPAYIFWDTEYSMWPERAMPFYNLIVKEHPQVLMNNRLGGGVLGDTQTPEQRIPPGTSDRAFEVNMTMNGSWGYNKLDNRWKSPQQLIRNISDIAGKGGNYLLNVSPDAEGVLPPENVERLAAIGKWMKINGEAIYATEGGPFPMTPQPPTWGRATQKSNANGGTTLYVHVWDWPADRKLLLPAIKQAPRSGRMLGGGAAVTSALNANGVLLTLPEAATDPDVSVLALEFAEPLKVETTAPKSPSAPMGTPQNPAGDNPAGTPANPAGIIPQ